MVLREFLQRIKFPFHRGFLRRPFEGKRFCFEKTQTNMDNADLLSPPENVRGMKVLDREAFNKTIVVTHLDVEKKQMSSVVEPIKKYFLMVPGVKVKELDDKQRLWLNPGLVRKFDDFDEDVRSTLKKSNVSSSDFGESSVTLTYENFKAAPILKAVLPKNEPPLTSYSKIGHIIHLNIKDQLLDYKNIIAQVLLDKTNAKTVVYKKNTIDNVYRNFEMEILCGEPNLIASTIEYGVKFEFDFSKVYWNPRLSTEHDRIVSLVTSQDALFDVFAGVGPFAIRAALKQCTVFANDLNPDSYKWLNHNIKMNKKCTNYITTFNKDGRDFILTDVKENLLNIWKNEYFIGRIHFVMNLPALALTFLKHFKGLISKNDLTEEELGRVKDCMPIIHCHFFVKEPDTVRTVFERDSGFQFDVNQHKFHFVRNVSVGKHMYRVTFEMPAEFILSEKCESSEPPAKRICSVGK